MTEVTMTVNGESVTKDIPDNTLMTGFLRDVLKLTGTHVGCDTSQCGACVIHLDGSPVKACSIFALECDGADITTIEGMADPDGTLHPVQRAFRDYHGLQCGFCTPGMVMTASAMLDHTPKPTEDEVREHLEGNLCRCTGYHNIVRAIMAASGQEVAGSAAE
ncbi:(2Fe-2S)-binding protein [Allosediminivita pacifica]|uniref:Carbon-monoxide dehydrogenase small subunit n=1 Tax=Allosediminivita pacifica TaxID=1267769 RepID=A0A2T6AWB4_9RHOB|nr:(2Fe-2S)-binding protein [Allosediminivita pacifica]PTX48112.1 carbon-monoxide dehydrogenase small subunit [Allosediminivita pacifica]GGB12271.1 carbon monoxide dehydrogenase [Allosediminivita pacifica]